MEEKKRITEIEGQDDQKILLNFLNSLKNEEQNLDEINSFSELEVIWKISCPNTDFRFKIDQKILKLLPDLLSNLSLKLELFFIEINKIIKIITPNSENEKLVLSKIREIVKGVEEKDLGVLIFYYGNWSDFKKGQQIIFEKIRNILETKSVGDLINYRSKNNWNKSIIILIDKILSENLPKILPQITSASVLLSLLKEFDYVCMPKNLIEERLVEIFKNNFLFSVFSFEQLYDYWKLFSNKSQGQIILRKAIIEDTEGVSDLSVLFKRMKVVDKIDASIRKIFYEKVINLVSTLKKNEINYKIFLEIILADIKKRNIPEELIPIFKKRAKEILMEK
jgi:hypothetical protein